MINDWNNIKRRGREGVLLILALIYGTTVYGQSQKLRVGFLSAAAPDHPFWGQVVEVMQAVAEDLDIELIVKYDPTRSTYATKRLGSHLINSGEKLDYMLTKYWVSVTDSHLEQARRRGTKVFIFNSDIPEADQQTVGRLPRQNYDNWIGHMVPDDTTAGYNLTGNLVEAALRNNVDDPIQVLALNAPFESTVGTNRLEGMKRKIKETPKAVLQDVVVTNWDADSVDKKMAALLKQYPETDVLWAAVSTIMAGALQAVEKSSRVPGKDILIGGFDWDPESLKAIADGRITASMFGHFMEGAWALILVHDYHHGFDFAETTGVRMSTPLNVMNAGNHEQYKALFEDGGWKKIDFRKFSKKYNPQLRSYNFNIRQFISGAN